MEYATQRTKNIAHAITAFVNELPANASKRRSGATIAMAGKLERM